MSILGYGSQLQIIGNELCLYKRTSINNGITIKYIDMTTLVEREVTMLSITPPPTIIVPITPDSKPPVIPPTPPVENTCCCLYSYIDAQSGIQKGILICNMQCPCPS